MTRFCHFLTWHKPGAEADTARIAGLLHGVPGLAAAQIHTPATAHDPYLHDGAPPALVVQTHFDDIAAMEAAFAPDGPLQKLADPALLPGATLTQQAMLARAFPVPNAPIPAGAVHCTYLVAYEGTAEDLNAWLAHYIAHHPPIMAKFPAIRGIEICTRLDWCGRLPVPTVAHMQRNKVVFDSPEALTAALASPVRHEMRADYHLFPPFSGPVTHFPMRTIAVGR